MGIEMDDPPTLEEVAAASRVYTREDCPDCAVYRHHFDSGVSIVGVCARGHVWPPPRKA